MPHRSPNSPSRARRRSTPTSPGTFLNDADAKTPQALHPAFYGCYDWHSAVHGHWMLVRAAAEVPRPARGEGHPRRADDHLTAENLKAEADYFNRAEAKSFERPYGWAWLLKLARGTARLGRPGREEVVREPQAARGADRGAVRRVLPEADVPDPLRRPPQHRVRPGVRPRLRPGGRQQEAAGADRGAGEGVLRQGRRRPGAVGAGRRPTSSRRACARRT